MMSQPSTPDSPPKRRNATPPKLAVRSKENKEPTTQTEGGKKCCNGCDSVTSSPSRPRAAGSRKDRSKQQIAAENQQLGLDQDGLEIKRKERQLRAAEDELYGSEGMDQTHDEVPGYDPSDESGPEDVGGHSDAAEEQEVQGRDVRNQVRQEREQRKGKRQQPHGSETGVRAFNLRRIDSNQRPLGMKVKRKDHDESTTRQPSSGEQDVQNPLSHIPGLSSLAPEQYREDEEKTKKEPSGSTEPSEPSPNAGKDVSIKFDLNMEIEILLKAKIKGEIMVTFM